MKKTNKILLVIIICLIFIGATIPFTLINFGRRSSSPSGHINIYVNSTIYNSLTSDVAQYKQDIINQGYTADIISWSTNDVTQLKNNLSATYSSGLIGAVLIGQLPYAKAQYWDSAWGMYRKFSCDLYLMDLDGNWTDVNLNNYYDVGVLDNNVEHNNGTADWFPEIWVARINPYTISEIGLKDVAQRSIDHPTTEACRDG